MSDYKALTYINLPFIERRFSPGDLVPRSDFDESAREAANALDDLSDQGEGHSSVATAEETIAALIEGGSLSEDLNAPIHPDNLIAAPGEVTQGRLVADAEALIAQLEAKGQEVPPEVQALVDAHQVNTADDGAGE